MTLLKQKIDAVAFSLILVFSFIYFRNISEVPFHPDESSKIFMSSDIETIKHGVYHLYWKPENSDKLQQKYRLLDAPLTRYLIGIGRQVVGIPPLKNDWDWGKNWEDNVNRAAFPEDKLLLVSRISTSFFYPVSLLLFYFTAKKALNAKVAIFGLLLFAFNSLVLLHTRRAMEEGPLIFTSILVIYLIISTDNPWLLGAAAGSVFITKHTGLIFVVCGIIGILWRKTSKNSTKIIFRNIIIYAIIIFSIIWITNPFIWKYPFQAIQAAVSERKILTDNQYNDFGSQNPRTILNSGINQFASLLGALYFSPPLIAEAGNYLDKTAPDEFRYFSNPINLAYHGNIPGILLLTINLTGFIYALRDWIKQKITTNRPLGLLVISSIITFSLLLIFIKLPFQRYYLILIPFNCIWISYCVFKLGTGTINLLRRFNVFNHS